MLKRRGKEYFIGLSIFLILLGGCSQDMQVSAEEIIHNAIESENEITDFYGKSEMKTFEGEEITGEMVSEEYVSDDDMKTVSEEQLTGSEVETIIDGEKMLVYDKTNESVMEVDTSEMGDIFTLSPKENFQSIIGMMEDSHTYEVIGEEELLDRNTFHIKLESKEANNLLGDVELWVDKESWFVVKTISETGEIRIETEYTELDFSPDFDKDTFTMDIPDDVEITNLDDMFTSESVTLEEAEDALGQEFFIFSEEDIQLTDIQVYELSNEEVDLEIQLTYRTNDDVPIFNLFVSSADDTEIEDPNMEIRGLPAEYEEMVESLTWNEEGLNYSLIRMDEEEGVDEIVEWAEDMVLSSETN
ncbi:LolA family protein [Oceanobacillus jeddahense]|uniref:Outer membrane lipoprotein carrier protein LolA n=1 Tax=Oceanobacillus jeddahense TaxID=1462527 RepID=A0ABY5K2E3_9BACI|nr:hypothetical protein [Oceanobacillus jeddahense]UUI04929.1 hypothetical protein NP439_09955 [Oceanobacillus jeddahense]